MKEVLHLNTMKNLSGQGTNYTLEDYKRFGFKLEERGLV